MTLYVPIGATAAYWSDDFWGQFNIIEEDISSIGTLPKDEFQIKTENRNLYIEINYPTEISIYNISGTKIYTGIIDGNKLIPLENGLYLITINNKSYKVIAK